MDKQKKVKKIFDSIAFRYDLLNHLLSLGLDFYWRKKALKLSSLDNNSKLLDVACGTGDFAIAAKKMGVNDITGADLSKPMLELFAQKCKWSKGKTVQMVAENIPFNDNSFSNITVAFGVRNFYELLEGFKSFHRILRPEGKATILEFRLPSNNFIKVFYKFYFKRILPIIGGLISGDKEAYKYLPSSVEEFDEKINLKEILNSAGFSKVDCYTLTFETVQVVIGTK
ncbi:MAG: bifunctional demethylmenaquinone methyltransferase/2-methoxy-6-polyprenyl-1,4-benzoquinol methylase UbiE [Ignavibacteria bacterium]|jgi:demethylmenaquinone methyltransferase/2-methoxy-6-polyprenyl-1,4-benzoquinol methylase